ncbi:hypothetical protein EV201_0861 [Ancylomarina subtilis]|uniref:Uncharacterized protein n=1 Tax=Ancylomarina subtilis TaxID=1639035 RepID=A0A4V2FT01_9BACT|nr:hypothetical protein [Ancylomarina subtilis]RZT96225.1 hypothetical protein EV201_0861 [Ancylomarina subtilis]
MKSVLIVVLSFCFIPMVYGQNDVKFVVQAVKDTVVIGDQVKLRFVLEGIECEALEQEEGASMSQTLRAIFNPNHVGNNFSTFISVKPTALGSNSFGPYKIKMLGREFISNVVRIYGIERQMECVKILMPKTCRLEGEAEIKLTNHSFSDYSIELKQTDIFQVVGRASSTQIVNGEWTKQITLNIILKKAGIFKLDKSMFKNLPEDVQVEPFVFEVN